MMFPYVNDVLSYITFLSLFFVENLYIHTSLFSVVVYKERQKKRNYKETKVPSDKGTPETKKTFDN